MISSVVFFLFSFSFSYVFFFFNLVKIQFYTCFHSLLFKLTYTAPHTFFPSFFVYAKCKKNTTKTKKISAYNTNMKHTRFEIRFATFENLSFFYYFIYYLERAHKQPKPNVNLTKFLALLCLSAPASARFGFVLCFCFGFFLLYIYSIYVFYHIHFVFFLCFSCFRFPFSSASSPSSSSDLNSFSKSYTFLYRAKKHYKLIVKIKKLAYKNSY